jgi:hypothetical protein
MRSAPAVQFPLGRSSWGAVLSGLPALLGVLVGVASGLLGMSPSQSGGVIVLACICGVAALRWGGWNRHGHLNWNGREWLWETRVAVTPLTQLRARLDGQRFLLLEAQISSGRWLWFWLEQGMAPALWHGVRQAVFLPGAVESAAQEPI